MCVCFYRFFYGGGCISYNCCDKIFNRSNVWFILVNYREVGGWRGFVCGNGS